MLTRRIRPFDEFMWEPFTMGVEAYPGSGGVPKGLCVSLPL